MSDGMPEGWAISAAAAAKGNVSVDNGMLVLAPNAANTPSQEPLGIGQLVDAGPFHGKRLSLSAKIGADGGAAAVIGLVALRSDGTVLRTLFLRADSGEGTPSERSTRDSEPLSDEAATLILFVSAEGVAGRASIDDVMLGTVERSASTEAGQMSPVNGAEAATTSFSLNLASEGRAIPPALFGTNVEWIRSANGLWNESKGRIDSDITKMARNAGITLIRFPGGVWSDTYNWRDGIGPQSARPTTRHIADQEETSRHVIGTDEIAGFAREIGAKLMITVNVGHGTAQEAGAWAAYIRDTHGAEIAPYWELGNELYMANDLSGGSLTPEAYAARAAEFAAAIRKELPKARIGGIGLLNFGPYRFNAHSDWNDVVVGGIGGAIDFYAIHNAYAPVIIESNPKNWRDVYRAMLAAPALIGKNLRDTEALLDKRAKRTGPPIGLAVTEWGPLFSIDPKNPFFDHVKTMGSAVFAARTLNVFARDGRVEAAAFFKLTDWLNSGWIAPVPGGGFRETPAILAFGMYRRTLGPKLVPIERQGGPVFSSNATGFMGSVDDTPVVDAIATRFSDGSLGVMLSNADLDNAQNVRLSFSDTAANFRVTMSVLTGPSADAHRGTRHIDVPGVPFAKPARFEDGDWFARSQGGTVAIEEKAQFTTGAGEMTVTLPPVSVVSLKLEPVR